MPKTSIDFPAQLSIQVTDAMRRQLIAIGYMTGNGGEYATPARNLLHNAIREYMEKLTPRERKDFDEILENVKLVDAHKAIRKENQKSPI